MRVARLDAQECENPLGLWRFCDRRMIASRFHEFQPALNAGYPLVLEASLRPVTTIPQPPLSRPKASRENSASPNGFTVKIERARARHPMRIAPQGQFYKLHSQRLREW